MRCNVLVSAIFMGYCCLSIAQTVPQSSGHVGEAASPSALDLRENQKATSGSSKPTARTGAGKAESPAPSSGCLSAHLAVAEKIQCLQAENAVMEAALKRAETKRKLDLAGDTRGLGLPSVLSTYGVGSQRVAVLAWKGSAGGALIVRAGDTLPDGWMVKSIDDGRVIVRSSSGSEATLLLDSGVSGANNSSAPQWGQTTSLPMAGGNSAPPAPPSPGGGVYSVPPPPAAQPLFEPQRLMPGTM